MDTRLKRRFAVAAVLGSLLAAPTFAAPLESVPAQGTDVCGELAASATWDSTGSPYRVTCVVQVPNGMSLTIQPGVEVRFAEAMMLDVRGTLTVSGASPSDVLFTTGQSPATPGSWRGIEIREGATATMAGFTIEYAGMGSDAALRIATEGVALSAGVVAHSADDGVLFDDVSGSVTNTELRDNAGTGLQGEAGTGDHRTLEITGVTFRDNAASAVTVDANVETILSNNTARDNGRNAVVIDSGNLDVDMTWYGNDLPYFLNRSVSAKSVLTIQPGTFVKSFEGHGLSVSEGSLSASGTAEAPIVFTSLSEDECASTGNRVDCDTGNDGSATTPGPGDWSTISLDSPATIDHIQARFGRDNMISIESIGVTLSNSELSNSAGDAVSVERVPAVISGMHIHDNAKHGVDISATEPVSVTVTGSTFEDNVAVLAAPADVILTTGGNSVPSFSNEINGYAISGDMTVAHTWAAGDLPFVLTGPVTMNRPAADLTLQPGVVIKMAEAGALRVSRGQLIAGISGADPVLITSVLDDACTADEPSGCDTNGDGGSTVGQKGSWRSIDIEREGRGAFLRSVIVRFGGASNAMIRLEHPQSVIEDTVIASSGDVGLSVAGVNTTTIERNTFASNEGHGLVIESEAGGTTVTLRNNSFVDNRDPGDDLAAALAVDANVQLVFDDSNDASGNELNGIGLIDGEITTSRTWSPSKLPFVVLDDVVVRDGATLTIDQGTVIKFDRRRVLRADRNGLVAVNGTEGNPVILTAIADDAAGGDTNPDSGTAPGPGDWLGIQFRAGSRGGHLDYTDVRYAGDDNDPTIEIAVANVTVRNSVLSDGAGDGVFLDDVPGAGEVGEVSGTTIRDMKGHGIVMGADERNTEPTIQNNEVRGSQMAYVVDATVAPHLGGNTATDNLVNGIAVRGQLDVRRTWERSELPWVLDGTVTVGSNGWLEIESGTVIKALAGAQLLVSTNGRIIVPKADTGDDQVIFTSVRDNNACAAPGVCDATSDEADPRRGEWVGMQVNEGANPAVLDGIVIRFAGEDDQALLLNAANSRLSNSVIEESGSDGLSIREAYPVEVVNNVIRRNVGVGISLTNSGGGTFTGNIMTLNARSMVHESSNPTTTGDNTAVGNAADPMLYCADVSVNTTWRNDLAREVRSNCSVAVSGGTLTIEPGSLIQFTSAGEISVRSRLEAEGVVFTASRPDSAPGAWRGIEFDPRSSGFSRHNLLIASGTSSRGGLNIMTSDVTALFNTLLRMDRTAISVSDGADPELRGNLIRDVSGSNSAAIRVSEGNSDPSIQANLIAGAEIGITTVEGQPKIHLNDIPDAVEAGVENRTSSNCIDAKQNWWGASTGPKDLEDEGSGCGPAKNENGQGVPVTEDVDYSSWLTERPPAAPVTDLPMCGATNQRSQTVAGRSSPGATVFVFDGEREVAQAVVGGDGRFNAQVDLGNGEHRLSFEARKSATLLSPRTGFRVVEVNDAHSLDAASIRFEYGPAGSRRKQPLHSVAGCATPCGERSSGRVELPPGEPVVVSARVSGAPSRVEFVQEGQAPQVMTDRGGGVFATASFDPVQAPFTIRVEGASPIECLGYVYPGGGGFVFADSGVEGDPALDEGFEGNTSQWRPQSPWHVTDAKGYQSSHSLATTPVGEKYGPNIDSSVIFPRAIDLTEIPSPRLTFMEWHHFAPGDRGLVEIQVGTSSNWTRLATFEDANGAWMAAQVPLEEYAAETQVFLRFRLDTDSDTDVGDGWWIDDVVVGPGGARNGRYDAGEPLIPDAEVLLEQHNLVSGLWEEWDPFPTGQSNPQETDDAGRYGFFNLPAGEYRVRVNGAARSPVLAVWTGSFDYQMPITGAEPVFLPILADKARINR